MLLQAKTVFGPGNNIGFEPKRRLVLSLFSNLKFIDGEIIPEWQEPFATIVNAGGIKQKSQNKSEISDLSSKWLPEKIIIRTIFEDAPKVSPLIGLSRYIKPWNQELEEQKRLNRRTGLGVKT